MRKMATMRDSEIRVQKIGKYFDFRGVLFPQPATMAFMKNDRKDVLENIQFDLAVYFLPRLKLQNFEPPRVLKACPNINQGLTRWGYANPGSKILFFRSFFSGFQLN